MSKNKSRKESNIQGGMHFKMTRGKKSVLIILICIILTIELISIPNNVKASTYTQTTKNGISNFPETYQAKLKELQSLHSSWTFTAYYTGISWDEFIKQETSLHLRNTVIKSSNSLWKDTCNQVASGYACASRAILQYYSDPRNFLTESGIFQFLEMTYNSSSQTEQGVQGIIASTFMNKSITFNLNGQEVTMPYSQIIMEAARESKMSPYSIAIKIRQEVGNNGSNSVSGYYVAKNGTIYEGYYNFFNYGAYDQGDAIANGLEYAKNKGWTNPYIAIVEGAKLMANSYTNAGQNTAYFYKWDVVGNEPSQLFSHQYMTNIQDPSSQAKSLFNTYTTNNMPNVNNLPTTIDEKLSTSYYVNGTGVRLRATPSTSASILATLSKNEVVTLLEWNSATANDLKWARIQLSNGNIGYVANKYLLPCNNNNTSTKNVRIDGEYLIISPNKTVSQIASALNVTQYSVTKNDKTQVGTNEIIQTGYIFTMDNKTYKVIVLGDVYTDGIIDSRDYMKIKNHIMATSILNIEGIKAANTYVDDIIDSRDYMKIKNHIMGTEIL